MPEEAVSSLTRYTAESDQRLIGLRVPADFEEYADFNPHDGRRSYLTEPELPLQIILVKGSPEDQGSKHVHLALPPARNWPTRHTVFMCVAGVVQVDLSEADGTPVGEAVIRPGDLILVTEGHQVTYLEADSGVIEIKQGPYAGSEVADRVALQ